MSMAAKLISIQVGLPQTVTYGTFGASTRKSWETSFIKTPIDDRVWLGKQNLKGDAQADLVHHGGPDKAVCVYPLEHYSFWRDNLKLPRLANGSFGENFTVSGLGEQDVCIGDVWSVGEATVQLSQPRQPCWKLARRWDIKDLADRVQQNGKTGWYFRVLTEGFVEAGMLMTLIQRFHPRWTVQAANHLMHQDKSNRVAAAELATMAELSSSWQSTLLSRASEVATSDDTSRLEGR